MVKLKSKKNSLRSERTTWAMVIVSVLIIAMGFGIQRLVVNRVNSLQTFSLAGSPLGPAGLSIPALNRGGSTSSWYCVWPNPTGQTSAGQIEFINFARQKSELKLFYKGATKAISKVAVSGNSIDKMSISSFSNANAGGVGVVANGGEVAVAVELSTPQGTVAAPCQATPGFYWVLQDGATTQGTHFNVAIFNPLQTTAVLDIRLLSPSGITDLGTLQGVVVRPGGTFGVDLSRQFPDHQNVVVEVRARSGSIVVSGLSETQSSTGVGASLLLGVDRPSSQWYIPNLTNSPGVSTKLVIFNPSTSIASANVAVLGSLGKVGLLSGTGAGGSHFSQTIQPQSFSVVDLSSSTALPQASAYGVSVSDTGVGLVVSADVVAPVADQASSSYSEPGYSVPAKQWITLQGELPSGSGLAIQDAAGARNGGSYSLTQISASNFPPTAVLPLETKSNVGKAGSSKQVVHGEISLLKGQITLLPISAQGTIAVNVQLSDPAIVVPISQGGIGSQQVSMTFPVRG